MGNSPATDSAHVPFRHSLRAKLLIGLLAALVMMLASVLAVFYARGHELLMVRERELAISVAQRLASDMGRELAMAEGLAVTLENLGEQLPRVEAQWRELIPRLLDLDGRADLIAGGGLWPEPGAFAADVERRSFFWGRDTLGELRYFDDYNAPDGPGYHDEEWYVPTRHQRSGHCYWSRSYQNPYSGEKMVTCSAPMRVGNDFIGASTVDLKLSGLQRFLDERGRALQGYAFALDRNGVFITSPPDGDAVAASNLATLAKGRATYRELVDFLAPPIRSGDDDAHIALAGKLDAATTAIDAVEARHIAEQLLDDRSRKPEIRQTRLGHDPFLNEAALATTLRMPGVGWHLVVVQPERLVRDAVQSVMMRVAWAMSLAIVVVIIIAGWLLRRFLVLPIRHMTEQLASTEHSVVPGRIDVPGNDELALLASRFNQYAERLAESHSDLLASAEQFRAVTELAHDALIQIDDSARICAVNRAGTQMFGWTETELLGEPLARLMTWDPRQDSDLQDAVASSRAASRVLELSAQRRDGSAFPADVSVSYWRGPTAGVYNIQVRDVSERLRAEERMRTLSTHDTLTGLPNRSLFNDRLKRAVERCLLGGDTMALFFLDLDHFKVANDSLGHSVGDALLQAVAERLLGCVRVGDTVARLGGDEFAILMPNLDDASESVLMAQRIIDAIGVHFDIGSHQVKIGVSIGITLCPGDDRQADQLLRKADLAMYHAKSEGRNTFRFFTERLHAELLERKAMLDAIANAISREEFELHYQPVLATHSRELHGVEALIRWRHQTLGLVMPDRFVPLAEQSGLIVAIGHWIIAQSIGDMARWDAQGLPPVRLAINLSPAQFRDPTLVDHLAAELTRHAVDASRIELELTETVLMEELDQAIAIMGRLRDLGIGLAIDDFGTGYSSLAYLKRFPVQKLKIDKSFVHGVAEDEDAAAICRAVIALGHNLGLRLVAEGVERLEDLNWLQQQRCDYIQGYFITAALPMPQLQLWVGADLQRLSTAIADDSVAAH